MLRRDINLLYSLTQATKKKSSSNLMLVLVVGVVLIVGLMTFLFVDAKMTVDKNQAVIDDLDAKLGQTSVLAQKQKEYNELKTAYQNAIVSAIAELAPQQYAYAGAKMSKTLIDVLMLTDDAGTPVFKVDITQLIISGNSITLQCSSKTGTDADYDCYDKAWDFVDYLAGNKLSADNPLSAAVIGGVALNDLIAANGNYFTGVEENYSGLPTKPENVEESISFNVKFTVNWEALQ